MSLMNFHKRFETEFSRKNSAGSVQNPLVRKEFLTIPDFYGCCLVKELTP